MKKNDLKILSDVMEKAETDYVNSGLRYGQYVISKLPERIVRSNPKFHSIYHEENPNRAKELLFEIMIS